MREILYRAKAINRIEGREYRTDYKNGDWVYGLVTKLYDERFPNLPAEMTNTDGVSGIDVDYKSISEFSGLKDKNGTNIFEGDIVKNEKGICFGGEYKACVEYYCAFGKYCAANGCIEFEASDFEYLEVIGNIFDNKLEDFENGC